MLGLLKIGRSRKTARSPSASGPALYDDSLPMYKAAPVKKIKGVPEIGDARFKPKKTDDAIQTPQRAARPELIPDLPDPSQDDEIMARLMSLGANTATVEPAPEPAPAPASRQVKTRILSTPAPSFVPAHKKSSGTNDDGPKFAPKETPASNRPAFLEEADPQPLSEPWEDQIWEDETISGSPAAATVHTRDVASVATVAPIEHQTPRRAPSLPIVPAPVRRAAALAAKHKPFMAPPAAVRRKTAAIANMEHRTPLPQDALTVPSVPNRGGLMKKVMAMVPTPPPSDPIETA